MRATRSYLRCGLFLGLALAAAACHDAASPPTAPGASAARGGSNASGGGSADATFTWSMPARFGLDANGDGLTDYPGSYGVKEQIDPPSWTVHLDACNLAAGTQYVWSVDNRRVASVTTCRYTHQFPAEGVYDVALHIVQKSGPGVFAEDTVTVQDWLILSLGDSYASGEGVPQVPAGNEQLVQSVDATFRDYQRAVDDVHAAKAALAQALERKGLAQAAVDTAEAHLSGFLDACTPTSFKNVKKCAEYLTNLAVSFATYDDADYFFEQAVRNAKDRLAAALVAVQKAEDAVTSAAAAVASAKSAIAAAGNGLTSPKWELKPLYPAAFLAHDTIKTTQECHRSAESAPARAALELERSDPHTSVTFVQLACSGARIDKYPGKVEDQIKMAEDILGSREIDAVLLSVGGDDAGFAAIITACVTQQPCYDHHPTIDPGTYSSECSLVGLLGTKADKACQNLFNPNNLPDTSAADMLRTRLARLPIKYDSLATVFFPELTGLLAPATRGGPQDPLSRLRSSRIYIDQYPDLTKNDQGAYCAFNRQNPLAWEPGVTPDEQAWLDQTATGEINQKGEEAASLHGWTYVSGIHASTATHGYCADAHWVNQIQESYLRQADMSGMAHPNPQGQANTARLIYAAMLKDLYPQGLQGPPRAPDPAPGPGQGSSTGPGSHGSAPSRTGAP